MKLPGKARKGDDEVVLDPYHDLDINSTLREARKFNERMIQPAQCSQTLTKVLYLLRRGEKFSNEEATSLFFSVTKLFQSQNYDLRRKIYLFIKEMAMAPDEALIVVSFLTKDMTSNNPLFRANSIRVLAKIMDAAMISGIERFLKQA